MYFVVCIPLAVSSNSRARFECRNMKSLITNNYNLKFKRMNITIIVQIQVNQCSMYLQHPCVHSLQYT